MEPEKIKKAVESAEKELEQIKQDDAKALEELKIEKIKEVVRTHLRAIAGIDEEIKEAQERNKILKSDLDDLKAGRLDKIEERQETDPKAKEVSIVIINRTTNDYPQKPWFDHYRWEWAETVFDSPQLARYITGYSPTYSAPAPLLDAVMINCHDTMGKLWSVFTSGTYDIDGDRYINL